MRGHKRPIAAKAVIRVVDNPFLDWNVRVDVDAPVPVWLSAGIAAFLTKSLFPQVHEVTVPCHKVANKMDPAHTGEGTVCADYMKG